MVFWCGALAIVVINVAFAKLGNLAQNAFGMLDMLAVARFGGIAQAAG